MNLKKIINQKGLVGIFGTNLQIPKLVKKACILDGNNIIYMLGSSNIGLESNESYQKVILDSNGSYLDSEITRNVKDSPLDFIDNLQELKSRVVGITSFYRLDEELEELLEITPQKINNSYLANGITFYKTNPHLNDQREQTTQAQVLDPGSNWRAAAAIRKNT